MATVKIPSKLGGVSLGKEGKKEKVPKKVGAAYLTRRDRATFPTKRVRGLGKKVGDGLIPDEKRERRGKGEGGRAEKKGGKAASDEDSARKNRHG